MSAEFFEGLRRLFALNGGEQMAEDDKAPPSPDPDGDSNVPVGQGRAGDGNDTTAYVGVDPIYQNYANETDRPLVAEEGVGKVLEEQAKDREDAAAAAARKVGVTGFTGSANPLTGEPPAKTREEELEAAAKRQTKLNRERETQRKAAREGRVPGQQV